MPEIKNIDVMERILRANELLAEEMKGEWSASRTLSLNLISSSGAGKTTLIEATLKRMMSQYRFIVLEGDIETERDAERIRKLGVDEIQITTGGTFHLESHMIRQAWGSLAPESRYDYAIIENVGNLVCPASYILGEHLRVVLLSLPEGDDKPAKYPKAFRDEFLL
jgi:hydrogenase nickel incorporation protein HypB